MRLLIILTLCVIGLGCEKSKLAGGLLSYPYEADANRVNQIKSGVHKLQVGDELATAITYMGRPDELNATFDKNNWEKRIGYSLVYVIRRDQKHGSVIDKNEALVRIHFNFDDAVTRIDLVGLTEPQANQ